MVNDLLGIQYNIEKSRLDGKVQNLASYVNDDALGSINTFLSKETDNKKKSDGYNVLGSIYVAKNNINDAKVAYNKALELNPDNEYAKTNLASLK